MAKVKGHLLQDHIKLCKKNLRSKRVKCCASCPFEEFIIDKSPGMAVMFEDKRRQLNVQD